MIIVIEGVKPYEGRYPLDMGEQFTTREWGWIKRLTGYLPLTIEEGYTGGDAELFACLAVIAMRRAEKIATQDVRDVFERLADAPFGATIRVEGDPADDEQEDDADPPASNSSALAKPPISGGDSRTSSETSEPTPGDSGTPDSGTSAWDLTRLVS